VTASFVGCSADFGRTVSNEWRRHRADALIAQATNSDDYKENVRLLKEATKEDPSYPRAWSRLCEAYQLTEELDLAEDACKHEIGVEDAGSGPGHNSLGLVYLAKKDYVAAADQFGLAVEKSKIPIIHYNFVWALMVSRQYEKAVPAAQTMIEVSANDPKNLQTAYEFLAAAYRALGQRIKEREIIGKIGSLDPTMKNIRSCEMKPSEKGEMNLFCTSGSI
jgi:tetratricopeptide (TPR) repeat protein